MSSIGAGIVVDNRHVREDVFVLVLRGRTFSTIGMWAFLEVDRDMYESTQIGDDLWFQFESFDGYIISSGVLIKNIEEHFHSLYTEN